jgi:hypothetical protein
MPLRIRFPHARPVGTPFLQQGSAQGCGGLLPSLREASRFLVSKRGDTGRPAATAAYSVRSNLPNRLPILSIEIALVGAALSEFLASYVADDED